MKRITFLERGFISEYRRIGDHYKTVTLCKSWKSGNLLYGYVDRFNVITIPIDDIRKIENI